MFKIRGPHGNRSARSQVFKEGQLVSQQHSQQPARHRGDDSGKRSQGAERRQSTATDSPLVGRTLAEYDRLMAKFENLQDISFLPDMYIVVRLDAHRLGHHWSSFPDAEYPLGSDFSQGLRAAVVSVMTSGIRVLFAYVHGDEMSVGIDRQELVNGRKKTRLVSGLASAASVGLCSALGRGALFHAKVCELPSQEHVVDYLMWQRRVARRNTIARYLGLKLVEANVPKADVDRILTKASEEERITSLQSYGINYHSLSSYERLGALLWWAPSPSPSPIRIEGQPYGIAECLDLPDDADFMEGVRTILKGTSVATEGESPVFGKQFPLPNLESEPVSSDRDDNSLDEDGVDD